MSVNPASPKVPPRPRAIYWLSQIAGWGAWCVIGLLMLRRQIGSLPAESVIGYGLFFGFSIGVTHLLRRAFWRRGWLNLPPRRALPRFAGAALGLAVVLTSFVVGVAFLQHGRSSTFAEPTALVVLATNLGFAAASWVTFYVTLSTWLRQQEARRRADALERSLGVARLQALEAQINPHFLFNCLNSLRGMIGEDPSRAQDMVTRLANILRHTLTRGREAATETLAEQLAVVADYLELESIRFDERLRTHFAIAPETRDCPLPAMLLQTLVENAIKHGIAHLPAGGEVTISSRVTDAHLELVVENPGELGTRSARSTGVGLANARERLRMLHGPDASLELQALTHHRVQARLRLPLRGPHTPSSVTSTETNSR